MITVRELVSGDDGWSWWWGRMCRERESKCICVPQIFWMRVSGDYWNANLKNRCGVLPSLTFQGNSKLSSHHSTNILLIYFTLLHDGTNKLTSKLSQKTQPNKIQKLHPKSRIQPLAPRILDPVQIRRWNAPSFWHRTYKKRQWRKPSINSTKGATGVILQPLVDT